MGLYAVVSSVGGFSREDSSSATLIGAYSDPQNARVAAISSHSTVENNPIKVDEILKGYIEYAKHFNVELEVNTPSKDGTLYAVVYMKDGFSREDSSTPGVVGIYTNEKTAHMIKRFIGSTANVVDFKPDHLAIGYAETAKAIGLKISEEITVYTPESQYKNRLKLR